MKNYFFNSNIYICQKEAKWKAAVEYCEDRLYEFKVMTEDELGVK